MKKKPIIQQQEKTEQEQEKEEDSDLIDVDFLFVLSRYSFVMVSTFIKARKDMSIKNIEDVYNALTDRETLDKLLQLELNKEDLKYKDEILDSFMSIRDFVRIEDLTF